MKQFDGIWIVWLLLVCIWNFGWPEASPIADVGGCCFTFNFGFSI